MSTLREVARRAGVSVATASRVANGGFAVRPETRDRVERAMRELLYVPPGRRDVTDLGRLARQLRLAPSSLLFGGKLHESAAAPSGDK